jgi:hypothetical protein
LEKRSRSPPLVPPIAQSSRPIGDMNRVGLGRALKSVKK